MLDASCHYCSLLWLYVLYVVFLFCQGLTFFPRCVILVACASWARAVFFFHLEVIVAFKRKSIKRRKSRRLFSKGAKKVHRKNGLTKPMRGGIRL